MPEVRRLYVHVGLQKTGTSFLQAAMLRGREALATQGLDLVPPTKRESFALMLAVRQRRDARRDPDADAQVLADFGRRLAASRAPRAVLSQESLAAAGPEQVERLLAACGDHEVHVVATVRDLARQLPSSWQEDVKAGGTTAYPEHLARLQELEAAGSRRHPWIHLDPPAVLERWGAALPPAHVHVVTVPPAGSAPTLLLERFARVLGVDPAAFDPEDRPANTSLGHVQAELLRRVNAELPGEVHRRHVYGDVVKRSFGARVLAPQPRRRTLVPAELRPWCEAVTARQVAALEAAGYAVEGSLEDLTCADAAFAPDVPEPTDAEVAEASVSALATVLMGQAQARSRRRRAREEGARHRLRGLARRLARR